MAVKFKFENVYELSTTRLLGFVRPLEILGNPGF